MNYIKYISECDEGRPKTLLVGEAKFKYMIETDVVRYHEMVGDRFDRFFCKSRYSRKLIPKKNCMFLISDNHRTNTKLMSRK